jgi:hypothetical protein
MTRKRITDWVNNHKGLCFELRENLSKEQVLAAWEEIRTLLGSGEEFVL